MFMPVMQAITLIRRAAALLLLVPGLAPAADVELAGVFGKRAVLMVDGGAPQTLGIGQRSKEGVVVLEVDGRSALIDVGGERRRVALGEAPLRIQPPTPQADLGLSVSLTPDPQGHYWAQGSINGAAMRFMVDTGATYVSIGADEARRAGIDYRKGREVIMNTANGPSTAWLLTLDRVSVGGIVLYGVQGTVHEQGLPVPLLGMSFLSRLGMRSEAGLLVLTRRY
ncbi:hypothetical protein B447_00280 [Thauera sp. 27]|nr:hypothetical protein B447_00280 [Thauera sp. 27]HAG76441.1 TIGR02281 family clan AA aspartic protease [Thauera sp.]